MTESQPTWLHGACARKLEVVQTDFSRALKLALEPFQKLKANPASYSDMFSLGNLVAL